MNEQIVENSSAVVLVFYSHTDISKCEAVMMYTLFATLLIVEIAINFIGSTVLA